MAAAAAAISIALRYVALASFLLNKCLCNAPCNESRAVAAAGEVTIELRLPTAPRQGTLGCEDAPCEWRVNAAAEAPRGLVLKFFPAFVGHQEKPHASNSEDSLGKNKVVATSGDGATDGAEWLELEVAWQRPEGNWLSSRMRGRALAKVQRFEVAAPRVVLRLWDARCSLDASVAPAALTSSSVFATVDGNVWPTREVRVALAAAPVLNTLRSTATAHDPANIFFAVQAGCAVVATAFILISCLCCRWRRKSKRSYIHRVSAATSTTYSAASDNTESSSNPGHCLLLAFNNFLRSSRRSLQLERHSSSCESREFYLKAPRGSGSFAVAWTSPDAHERRAAAAAAAELAAANGLRGLSAGSLSGGGGGTGAEQMEAALLADEASFERLLSRLDRLVLAFRRPSGSADASSQGTDASADVDAVSIGTGDASSVLMMLKSLPHAAIPCPPMQPPPPPQTPELWGSPRSEALYSCRSSSDLSELSCISTATSTIATSV